VTSLPLLAFIALPILALFGCTDLQTLIASLNTPEARAALQLSMQTTMISTSLAILLGTPVALLLAQPDLRFGRALDTFLELPIVIPPLVAGIALLMAFGRRGVFAGPLNKLGVTLPFTPVAVILAQLFVAAPFYVKAALLGFSAIDADAREAAAIDGANRWQLFRKILVPLAWPALLSGIATTWALGEFRATIIFAGNFPGRT
jgi:molybdate transport system permease protein